MLKLLSVLLQIIFASATFSRAVSTINIDITHKIPEYSDVKISNLINKRYKNFAIEPIEPIEQINLKNNDFGKSFSVIVKPYYFGLKHISKPIFIELPSVYMSNFTSNFCFP